MQTRTVINKIRWIRSQTSDGLEEWMFPHSTASTTDADRSTVEMIHDVSRFGEVLSRDATAVEILRAFGLSSLADRKEFIQWLEWLVSGRRRTSATKDTPPEDSVATAWWAMIGSVDPIEKLTTPEEMRTPELPETFISFELASIDAENTPLSRLAKATVFAEEAYETVFRAYQTKGHLEKSLSPGLIG